MVLAVHVVGYGAAYADPLRAGHDRQAPAARHHQPLDVAQHNSGLAGQSSRRGVERDQRVLRQRPDVPAKLRRQAVPGDRGHHAVRLSGVAAHDRRQRGEDRGRTAGAGTGGDDGRGPGEGPRAQPGRARR